MATKRDRRRHRTPSAATADPGASAPGKLLLTLFDEKSLEELELASPAEAARYLGGSRVVWLHVTGAPSPSSLEQLRQVFKLHPLALEDVQNIHQRPKVEDYHDNVFIVLRIPFRAGSEVHTEQVSLFFGKQNWIISFEESAPDVFLPVRQRLRAQAGSIRREKADYLLYVLMDHCIDSFFPLLESLCDRVERLEDAINLRGIRRTPVEDIHGLRQDLLTVRRAVWSTRDMLSNLLRNDSGVFQPDTLLHLRDCYDHCLQILDLVEVYRELAKDLMELYLTQSSLRQNEIMKVLTVISAIFIPLSFVAGVYGMNFDPAASPWNMPELQSRFGYVGTLGFMATLAIGLLIYFHAKGWIGK